MNISFDETELSTLGLAINSLEARSLAEWKINSVEIPGRDSLADLSTTFEPGITTLGGFLSADTYDWSAYTKAAFLDRLGELKSVLDPRKGFRKLTISGDAPDRFRWCRFASMSLVESKPVFTKPFEAVSIQFQNYEPYWRETAPLVETSIYPSTIPNVSQSDVRPIISLTVADTLFAFVGSVVQPVTLMIMDDFQISWKGPSTGALAAGDLLIIDTEQMTVIKRPNGGTGTPEDVIRYYAYGGPSAYATNGFPVIRRGGSTLSYIHPLISKIQFNFDYLYL